MRILNIHIGIIVSLLSVSCGNNQDKKNHEVDKEKFYYLNDFIKPVENPVFHDTSKTATYFDFISESNIVPPEFGELILSDIIKSYDSKKFVYNNHKKTGPVREVMGWRTSPRFDPSGNFSDSTYFLSISYETFNGNFGECIVLDFGNEIVDTWYWPPNYDLELDTAHYWVEFSYISLDKKYPALKMEFPYELVHLDSTDINFEQYNKDIEFMELKIDSLQSVAP